MEHIRVFAIILGMISIAACSPAVSSPAPAATEPQAAPLATATSEALIPAGWATYTGQKCGYAISYPPEMQVTDQNPYSQTLLFKLADVDAGARNFLYVSVIDPEIESMVKQGVYQHEVYNYDPPAADILLNLQVGESRSVHQSATVASGFTFQRLPDTTIGGHPARAYENAQPWEFPIGTKEIRYTVSLDKCTYLIGGYMDTAGAQQPGTVTEHLFRQIVATIKLMP